MSRCLRVCVEPLVAGEQTLERMSSRYVARVHRLRAGDDFVAFDPTHRLESDAVVLSVRGGIVRCRLAPPRQARLVSALRATLMQAIGKGDRVDRVVSAATALGAARLVVVETERSVVCLGDRAAMRLARWRSLAVEAARQCGRGDLPEVTGPVALLEAVQASCGDPGMKLCLEGSAPESMAEALTAWEPDQDVTLLIGPEGGFSARELAQIAAAGYLPARLGPFTLRTEIAATAALALVLARLPLK